MKNLKNRFAFIAVSLVGGVIAAGCSSDQASQATGTGDQPGNISLNVTGSDAQGNEFEITTIDISITDADGNVDAAIPDFDVSGPGSSVDLFVTLEEGEDYVISATGTGSGNVDIDGDGVDDPVTTPCTGTVTFDIVDDEVTPVVLTMLCEVPGEDVATGEAELTAEFVWERNPECGIQTVLAGPLTVGLDGGLINLYGDATDGTDYEWSIVPADLGVFTPNATAPVAKFDCTSTGTGTITLTVTNEEELCDDEVEIAITCTSAFVCDGVSLDPGEQCDGTLFPAGTPAGAECSDECRIVECGDGDVEGTEVCDDGNTVSEDGCNADCSAAETCGDGVIQAGLGELCENPGTQVPGAPAGVLCEADCTYDVPTCAECTASNCGAQLTACTDAANGTKCTDVMTCFDTSDCALGATTVASTVVEPCFCGTFGALDCAGGYADGPCIGQARLAGSATATQTSVLNTLVRFDDPSFAIGDVKNLVLCQIGSCNASCEQY